MFSTNTYLSKFNALTHAQTRTPVAYQGNETEEKVFKKRKVFKEDLKELTDGILNTRVSVEERSCREGV